MNLKLSMGPSLQVYLACPLGTLTSSSSVHWQFGLRFRFGLRFSSEIFKIPLLNQVPCCLGNPAPLLKYIHGLGPSHTGYQVYPRAQQATQIARLVCYVCIADGCG
jgi:hypothetical protein